MDLMNVLISSVSYWRMFGLLFSVSIISINLVVEYLPWVVLRLDILVLELLDSSEIALFGRFYEVILSVMSYVSKFSILF